MTAILKKKEKVIIKVIPVLHPCCPPSSTYWLSLDEEILSPLLRQGLFVSETCDLGVRQSRDPKQDRPEDFSSLAILEFLCYMPANK